MDAGRPVIFLLTERQMSDHKGATLIYPIPLDAATLIADTGVLVASLRGPISRAAPTFCVADPGPAA